MTKGGCFPDECFSCFFKQPREHTVYQYAAIKSASSSHSAGRSTVRFKTWDTADKTYTAGIAAGMTMLVWKCSKSYTFIS